MLNNLTFLFRFTHFILCAWKYACMYVCTTCMPDTCRGQNKAALEPNPGPLQEKVLLTIPRKASTSCQSRLYQQTTDNHSTQSSKWTHPEPSAAPALHHTSLPPFLSTLHWIHWEAGGVRPQKQPHDPAGFTVLLAQQYMVLSCDKTLSVVAIRSFRIRNLRNMVIKRYCWLVGLQQVPPHRHSGHMSASAWLLLHHKTDWPETKWAMAIGQS